MAKVNILLVDDRPANLLALEAILERPGPEPRQGALRGGGPAATWRSGSSPSSCSTSRCTGSTASRRPSVIRGREKNRRTPIVFVTAHEGDRLLGGDAPTPSGAVDYLVKPLVPVILRSKVAGFIELFEKTRGDQAPGGAAPPDGTARVRAEAGRRGEPAEGQRAAVRLVHAAPARAWPGSRTPRAGTSTPTTPPRRPSAPRDGTLRQDRRRGLPARDRGPVHRERPQGAGRAGGRPGRRDPGGRRGDRSAIRSSAGSPSRARTGEAALVGGMAIDFTDFKQAEAALRQSEEYFRTLADSIPQLAWMARPDGHILWYNRRWYEYTGTTLEQMEGWGWQSVHDPDELPRVLEKWTGRDRQRRALGGHLPAPPARRRDALAPLPRPAGPRQAGAGAAAGSGPTPTSPTASAWRRSCGRRRRRPRRPTRRRTSSSPCSATSCGRRSTRSCSPSPRCSNGPPPPRTCGRTWR